MITVSWKDQRQMCGIKFIRLEDFLDSQSQGMPIYLEPQGILFAEVFNLYISVLIFIRPHAVWLTTHSFIKLQSYAVVFLIFKTNTLI